MILYVSFLLSVCYFIGLYRVWQTYLLRIFFAVLSPIAENMKAKFYKNLVILYAHNSIINA